MVSAIGQERFWAIRHAPVGRLLPERKRAGVNQASSGRARVTVRYPRGSLWRRRFVVRCQGRLLIKIDHAYDANRVEEGSAVVRDQQRVRQRRCAALRRPRIAVSVEGPCATKQVNDRSDAGTRA